MRKISIIATFLVLCLGVFHAYTLNPGKLTKYASFYSNHLVSTTIDKADFTFSNLPQFSRQYSSLSLGAKMSDVSPEYTAIKDVEIIKSYDGEKVACKDLWNPDDVAVLVCFRSFG